MKRICIFFLATVALMGQNFEPSQRRFFVPAINNSVLLSGSLPYFQQDRILMGWHWDSFWAIDRAVGANQREHLELTDVYFIKFEPIADNCLYEKIIIIE